MTTERGRYDNDRDSEDNFEAVEKCKQREFVILSNAKDLAFVSLKQATKSRDCRVAHCKTVATPLLAMTEQNTLMYIPENRLFTK